MKKKLGITTLVCFTLASLSNAYAGSMGPNPPAVAKPYFAGEAAYTWRQIDAPTINSFSGTASSEPWGFRVSAGILRFYTEKLGLTAEIGGGYYGNTPITAPLTSSLGNIAVNGFDVLVGALYKLEHFDVFAQIGFMGENTRLDFTRYNLERLFNGNLIRGKTRVRSSNGDFLPEIRVGGIYNVLDHVGVTLAYMHTFGSTMTYNLNNSSVIGNGINRFKDVNFENPTLNSILLGLRYYIV